MNVPVQGVSDSPCSDIYCGTEGGSELETQALQNEGLRLQVSGKFEMPQFFLTIFCCAHVFSRKNIQCTAPNFQSFTQWH